MIAVLPSMIHPKTAVLGRAGGHFYIDIYIAAIVVLASCYRTKEAQGGDAEGVLQFFGMRCDEGYVFFSCFHS